MYRAIRFVSTEFEWPSNGIGCCPTLRGGEGAEVSGGKQQPYGASHGTPGRGEAETIATMVATTQNVGRERRLLRGHGPESDGVPQTATSRHDFLVAFQAFGTASRQALGSWVPVYCT